MRLSKTVTGLSLISFSIFAIGCATVPKQDSLLDGIAVIDTKQSAPLTLKQSDPTCVAFYDNVLIASQERRKNKQTNNQLASFGVSVLGAVVGVPPVAQVAGRQATNIIATQTQDIPNQKLDPNKAFDAQVITAARKIGCPVTTI